MNNLTLIVLTKDEAVHLERCLKSVGSLASQIIVVDSGSTDGTVELAKNSAPKHLPILSKIRRNSSIGRWIIWK